MHLSSNFLENVMVVVTGGLVIKLLGVFWTWLRTAVTSLRRPDRMVLPSWLEKLERWREEHRRPHFLPENRAGYTWILALAVAMTVFGYYAAQHRSGIDDNTVVSMAHEYVQRRYQKEINLLRHVRFSSADEEQVEDEGNGKFTVRGWYAWQSSKTGEKQQRWICTLHSQDGGRSWQSDYVKKVTASP